LTKRLGISFIVWLISDHKVKLPRDSQCDQTSYRPYEA
jgi:hypothetical protein